MIRMQICVGHDAVQKMQFRPVYLADWDTNIFFDGMQVRLKFRPELINDLLEI
jgi:hypothetical protein